MVALQAVSPKARTETHLDFDAIVIGAGVAGLYQLYKVRELGLRVRASGEFGAKMAAESQRKGHCGRMGRPKRRAGP